MLAGLALPIAAGLAGTLAPAVSGQGFATLGQWPGLPRALALSVGTGLISTLAALAITVLMIAALHDRPGFVAFRRVLSPLLALPHAAAALGLAFLVAPSGWLVRLISPWATGWDNPPDLLILNDPMGIALTLGLVAKEVPFLMLMALAILPQTDIARRGQIAASLGYGRVMGFVLSTLPALYKGLRLPVFAVLAYGGADHRLDGCAQLAASVHRRRRGLGATGPCRGHASALAWGRAGACPPDPGAGRGGPARLRAG
jgi:putative thiamine transport system permease protein